MTTGHTHWRLQEQQVAGNDKGLGYQHIALKNVYGNNYLSVCSGCIPDINIGKFTSDPEKSYAQWWAPVVVHENGKKYLSFMNEFGPLTYQTGKLCDGCLPGGRSEFVVGRDRDRQLHGYHLYTVEKINWFSVIQNGRILVCEDGLSKIPALASKHEA
ncbi:MAG: hypothetical protein J3Q66DRAFT_365872 [Benniella sp.]|nr:MAG: hypothetical protein J3Q66DRAFT_365872 [Benniella sp.]